MHTDIWRLNTIFCAFLNSVRGLGGVNFGVPAQLIGVVQNAHGAVIIFNQRATVFNPVAGIAVAQAILFKQGGRVNVAANNAVIAAPFCLG